MSNVLHVRAVIVSLLAIYCFITDLRFTKIYNHATLPGIVLGFVLNAWLGGMAGFKSSLIGFAIGFGALLILFYLGGMGGGDVKLMGAVGAVMGYPFIVHALVFTALTGGILGLFVAANHGILLRSFKNIFGRVAYAFIPGKKYIPEGAPVAAVTVPYGVAIAAGTLWALFI